MSVGGVRENPFLGFIYHASWHGGGRDSSRTDKNEVGHGKMKEERRDA